MAQLGKILFLLIGAVLCFGVAAVYYVSIAPESYEPLSKIRITPGLSEPLERGSALREGDIETFTIYLDGTQNRSDFAFLIDHSPAMVTALTGRMLTQTVAPGTLLERRFFEATPPEAFANTILPGNNAFSVDVRGTNSVMNFVVPGSIIDVFGTLETETEPRAEVLLDAVQVMAIDDITSLSSVDEGALQTRSITIQATPQVISSYLEKVERLQGDLLVTLRGRAE